MPKKRGEHVRQSQSSMDFLALTGVILAIIIPFLFYSGNVLDAKPGVMSRNVDVLQTTVTSLSHLGPRNSDTVYITTPNGVASANWEATSCDVGGDPALCTSKCDSIRIDYEDGQRDYVELDYPACGTLHWLYEKGNYYITLYNDEENIIFLQCGDGIVTGYEQCEPCAQNSDCQSNRCDIPNGVCKPPPGTGNNYCNVNGYLGNACKASDDDLGCLCMCTSDDDCPGVCLLPAGVCGPCTDSSQCPDDTYCSAGVCRDCDVDGDGYHGVLAPNCDPPLDCDDNPFDDPPPPLCDPPACGDPADSTCAACIHPGPPPLGEICDDGVDNDCDGDTDCADAECVGDPTCTGFCGDGTRDVGLGEECDGNDLGGCVVDQVCVPAGNPNECTCTYCGNGDIEGGQGETCEDDTDCAFPDICLPPGDPLECTCFAVDCGNAVCGAGETPCNCPADCTADVCGDLCVSGSEECESDADCPGTCDLGSCMCDPFCGDAVCDASESPCNCPADCTADVCGDSCVSGSEECEANAHCGSGEVCFACSCEPESDECGDGTCDPAKFENCATCLPDCQCPLNLVCNAGSGTCQGYQGGPCTECCGAQECGPGPCCLMSCGLCMPGEICVSNMCVPIPVCGNGQIEYGEECEVDADCPPIVGFTESCSVSCACDYVPDGGGGDPPLEN